MDYSKFGDNSPDPSLSPNNISDTPPGAIDLCLQNIISLIQSKAEANTVVGDPLKERILQYLNSHTSADLTVASDDLKQKINDYLRKRQTETLSSEQDISNVISQLEMELEIDRTTPAEVMEHVHSVPFLRSDLVDRVNVIFNDITGKISLFSKKTDSGLTVHAFRKREMLGRGGSGTVFAIDSIARPVIEGIGELIIKESHRGLNSCDCMLSMQQEYNILKELHEKKDVIGIQSPIYLVHTFDVKAVYFGKKFEMSLDELTAPRKVKLSGIDLLMKCRTLLLGLEFLHKSEIVHGDIKPANLCSEKDEHGHEEFKLADFGGARHLSQINRGNVFTIFTKGYVDQKDLDVARNIKMQRTTKFLTDKDLEILHQDAIMLAQKHDVYALGKSLREIFEDVELPTPEIKKQFDDLISAMMDPDYKQRIDSHTAAKEYQKILDLVSK